ncbi:MAG: helix-turn-helix domain-containing protein [Bacteroidota bacterium]
MSVTFQLIDVIIFIGICQGIFLSLTLQRIANNNKKANAILSLLIIISTVMLIGRFLMVRFFSYWVFQWSLLVDVVIFLFGPLFYLYTQRLLFKQEETHTFSKLHYLPAILFFVIAVFYCFTYETTTYFEMYRQGKLDVLFGLTLILGMVSNFYYLFRAFGLLRKFRKEQQNAFSFRQGPVKYIHFFLLAISLILVAWLLGYLNAQFFGRVLPFIGYDAIWAAIPVFIYVIGYFSLKQPELFRIRSKKEPTKQKNRLSPSEAALLSEKLDSLMSQDKIFLQSDLTLVDISEKLNTSTNNLSWLLNHSYQTTFYDFINSHRIKEFLKKVANNEHLRHTILALSMEVGFNSKSTFNKAFKSEMNDTPSNYIKKHRAA